MSMWTHITACMSVETYTVLNRIELKREVQKILRRAPKITGSEGNADIFINIPSGYNFSTSRDCAHCKYRETRSEVVIDGETYQKCEAPDNYNCSGKYQTCVVISIQGDLRDRLGDQTKREFKEFLDYVKSHYYVRDYSINIEGE